MRSPSTGPPDRVLRQNGTIEPTTPKISPLPTHDTFFTHHLLPQRKALGLKPALEQIPHYALLAVVLTVAGTPRRGDQGDTRSIDAAELHGAPWPKLGRVHVEEFTRW